MHFGYDIVILYLVEHDTNCEYDEMYFKDAVKIPDIPGKIIKRKMRETVYIEYQYGCTYIKEKKYALPRRTVIGKAVANNSDMMLPNEKYYEYFPEDSVPQFRNDSERSCGLNIGAWIVIDKIIQEYHLDSLVENVEEDNPGLLLDLAAFMIITEDNAGFYYPDYAFNHPLFSKSMTIFSDVTVSKFIHNLTLDQRVGFLNSWNASKDHRQRIYISYDSTNKNCQAGDVEIAEWGKPKVDIGAPQINLSIAYDRTNSIPLFYEDYPGSINDSSQFRHALDKVFSYGYRSIGFILDRGYFSKSNLEDLDSKNYDFIIMLKGRKQLVSEIVMENRNTFETARKNYIREYNAYGITIEKPLFAGDTKNRYTHLYYNVKRQAAEQEALERTLERVRNDLEKNLMKKVDISKDVLNLFNVGLSKDGELLYYAEKEDVIERLLQLCGYFCIITSSKMSAKDALKLYKSRDETEKLFRSDKSFLGSGSMRVHSTESVRNKIFIEFIALIIRCRMFSLLHDLKVTQHRKVNYLCVPKAIQELEKIQMVREADGIYRMDHAVTATQKTILSAFGMDEKDVWKKSLEISRLLSESSQVNEDFEHVEDEEDYDEDAYDDIY